MGGIDPDLVVLRNHTPVGGGYGVELRCDCGRPWSADHQFERLAAARSENEEAGTWWKDDHDDPADEIDPNGLQAEIATLAERISTAISGGREYIGSNGIRFDVVTELERLAGNNEAPPKDPHTW